MNKPKKSLRMRKITAWHSAGFSLHADPHVRMRQCEHSLFIHVWTFGAGIHAPVWMHLLIVWQIRSPTSPCSINYHCSIAHSLNMDPHASLSKQANRAVWETSKPIRSASFKQLRWANPSEISLAPYHRSMIPKFVTPTAPSSIDNSWRSTTLSPPKKLTSSTASLEWCHVHFIRDSYSKFIRRIIGPSKNSMEVFINAQFDFKSTRNLDSTASHHKHPVCQSPAGDAEKLTNVWWRYFGTNRIIDNWHWCLGVMWRKRKNDFHK